MTSSAYSRKFDEAVALALDAFRPITRKGSGVPYMTHLLSVTALVGEYGGDEDQLIAAVLHDYIEDIPGATREALAERFGERVASLVVELSDCDGAPKPPWRERKEGYLAHLRVAEADVKLISCADKLHNAQSIVEDHARLGDAIYARFRGRKDGTLWYYRSVCDALGEGWESPLLDRLRKVVDELHRVSGVVHPGR
ncbi:MAG: HD domain-containing protein [Myxococcota bacterium]